MTASSRASARISYPADDLARFEAVVRSAHQYTEGTDRTDTIVHPFDERNIHPDLPPSCRRLFDDGHYAQATFEAFKFVDQEVQRISSEADHGLSLMMRVFGGKPPKLRLNPGMTLTEQSEQEGYKFLFGGAMAGIRNPRGHSTSMADDTDTCLGHLAFATMLLRKLEEAGLR